MASQTINPGRRRERRSKRALLADGLHTSRLGALLLRLPSWRGVLVLSYHRIGDASRSDLHHGLWSATADALDSHLKLVTRHFDVIAPDQLGPASVRGRGRRVMVTFDDGYRDLFDAAYPVLQANGVRAAMFLCSGLIDRLARAWWDEIAWMLRHSARGELPAGPWSPRSMRLEGPGLEEAINVATRAYWELEPAAAADFLVALGTATRAGRRPAGDDASDWITWEMARTMSAAGHRIGAHTVTHPLLARLSTADQSAEIAGSLDRIEAEVGERASWLAYPVGTRNAFNASSLQAAREAGIELGFSNYGGLVTAASFTPFDVRRIPVETLRSQTLFSAALALPRLFVPAAG